MLLYAWPPAFFKAAKRVSPQSSVNYTQTVKFRVEYCHSHKMISLISGAEASEGNFP
jgi:hypothetical protein